MIELPSYQKSLANPFAAKLGSGAGDYADLTDWAAWLMDDWQVGVGQKDPTAGGFLYAEADTRFANRLLLPPLWIPTGRSTATIRTVGDVNGSGNLASTITSHHLTVQNSVWVGRRWTQAASETIYDIYFWAEADTSLEWYVAIYADAGGVVDEGAAPLGTTTVTSVEDVGYHWLKAHFASGVALTATTVYWFVVVPSTLGETGTLPAGPNNAGQTYLFNDNVGSSPDVPFASSYGPFFFPVTSILGTPAASGPEVTDIVHFNSLTYAASGAQLYKYTVATKVWAAVGSAFGANITDLHVLGDTLLIGLGDSTNYQTMNAAESFSAKAVPGRLFMHWGGLVYRAVANDLYYSSDLTTWSSAFAIGPDGTLIRGLSGLGNRNDPTNKDIYLSSDDGLYYFGAADVVTTVTPWPARDSTNGRGMLSWNGDLYIPIRGSLLRYTAGGQMIPIGLDRGEGLPAGQIGKIRALIPLVNWLIALVEPDSATGRTTLWAYESEGWHNLAALPMGLGAGGACYEYTNNLLYVGTDKGMVFVQQVPDSADNPVKQSSLEFYPFGWLETDWFAGGLKEVQKDIESIYVSGENIGTTHPVKVYWQDDASTGWELLGTFDAEREEIRWEIDGGTRPDTRQVKLALRLETADRTVTPSVEAVRLKYVDMVTDRNRWQVAIRVADDLLMLDGNTIERDADQQRSDLDEAAASVPPVILNDLDNNEYEVKVERMSESIGPYHAVIGDRIIYESTRHLTLLEVGATDA